MFIVLLLYLTFYLYKLLPSLLLSLSFLPTQSLSLFFISTLGNPSLFNSPLSFFSIALPHPLSLFMPATNGLPRGSPLMLWHHLSRGITYARNFDFQLKKLIGISKPSIPWLTECLCPLLELVRIPNRTNVTCTHYGERRALHSNVNGFLYFVINIYTSLENQYGSIFSVSPVSSGGMFNKSQ